MKHTKRFLSIVFLIVSGFYSQAQVTIDIKVVADTVEAKKYAAPNAKEAIQVRMAFGSYNIRNPHVFSRIKGKKISKVSLVYTDYPQLVDMTPLNNRRLLTLYMYAPQLFNNPSVKWEYYKQTGANASNAHSFFHGFTLEFEQQQLSDNSKITEEYFRAIIEGKEKPTDSTVLKVFTRNNDWDDMLVVCDFTGSMEPYVAEVLLWHHLSFDPTKNRAYVFFNDGDDTPDHEKIIGKTGGLYDYAGSDINELIQTAIKSVEGGSGGDIPENDIEAVLYGIEKYPELETVVLIADNWSNMRDFELYEQVDRPVKVILCGVHRVLNLQYLNLAYKTGGSVHTIEQDITDLISLKEGETIKINDVIYIIKDREFFPASEI